MSRECVEAWRLGRTNAWRHEPEILYASEPPGICLLTLCPPKENILFCNDDAVNILTDLTGNTTLPPDGHLLMIGTEAQAAAFVETFEGG